MSLLKWVEDCTEDSAFIFTLIFPLIGVMLWDGDKTEDGNITKKSKVSGKAFVIGLIVWIFIFLSWFLIAHGNDPLTYVG